MADSEKGNGRYLLRDAQRVLLLPLIAGSLGLSAFSGRVLSTRLDAEIEARLHLYHAVREIRAELRVELRDHKGIDGHAAMMRLEAILEQKIASIERRLRRLENGHK